MRSRVALITFALAASALAIPLAAHAASIPFFGPIIENEKEWLQAGSQCALGWGALILVINNIIRLLLTITIVFILPLVVAYAGFLLVVNPVNPSGKAHAKQILLNTIIGVIIALASWLIVDLVMATLYNPQTPIAGGTLGAWYNIVTTGGEPPCLKLEAELSQAPVTTRPPSGVSTLPRAPLLRSADCSPETITAAARAGGYTLTSPQANTLSCIAVPESSCGKNLNVARTVDGKPTTASGMFQIVFGQGKNKDGSLNTNDSCHNLNIPVCTDAANAVAKPTDPIIRGDLNCSTAFSGGEDKKGMEARAAACRAAAANINCNASAAACLVARNPNFSDWTADPRSSTQQACVRQYSGPVASFQSFLSFFHL